MKYPIEIYRQKKNPIILVLGNLFIAGFGLVCILIALDLYKNSDGLIERFGKIIFFLFGSLMLLHGLATIFMSANLNRTAIRIDSRGVSIDQIIKVGPIAWQDIAEIRDFDNALPNSYGLQRLKGIDIIISNPHKYISLAKEQNKGLFSGLKILTQSWLYFGKIKISEHEVDIELNDLSRIFHQEREFNTM